MSVAAYTVCTPTLLRDKRQFEGESDIGRCYELSHNFPWDLGRCEVRRLSRKSSHSFCKSDLRDCIDIVIIIDIL